MAQEDKPDNHLVTGSRIISPVGPVWVEETLTPMGPKCVEPTCGGLIDPKEGGGSDILTTEGKNQENKTNKERAKKVIDSIKGIIKGTAEISKFIKNLFSGSANIHNDDVRIMIYPDGRKEISGECRDIVISMGSGEPQKPVCGDIKGGNQLIRKADGSHEMQFVITYEIYRECYYTKKCGVQYYSFIAGSEAELNRTLNEVLGENFFQ